MVESLGLDMVQEKPGKAAESYGSGKKNGYAADTIKGEKWE